MEATGIMSVGAITVICYLLAQLVKATSIDNKWIPLICLASGGILGIPGMYIMQDFPAHDIITAVAVGIVSGGAATGINQAYRQMTENKDDKS